MYILNNSVCILSMHNKCLQNYSNAANIEVQYTVHSKQYTVHSTQYIVHSTQYKEYTVHRVHSTQYTAVLFVVHVFISYLFIYFPLLQTLSHSTLELELYIVR